MQLDILRHVSSYFSLYKMKSKIMKNIYRCFHKFLIENKWEGKYKEMVRSERVVEFWDS